MTPSQSQAISVEVTNIHTAAYERALSAPVVTDITELSVICRLAFALSEADEVLLERGLHDSVHEARHAFQAALSPSLRAAVEHATGRTVSEHSSHTDLGARLTVETFLLAPAVIYI